MLENYVQHIESTSMLTVGHIYEKGSKVIHDGKYYTYHGKIEGTEDHVIVDKDAKQAKIVKSDKIARYNPGFVTGYLNIFEDRKVFFDTKKEADADPHADKRLACIYMQTNPSLFYAPTNITTIPMYKDNHTIKFA